MTSKQVKALLLSEKGMETLYKNTLRYFQKIDECADLFTDSDLLDEFQLSHSMDNLSGCYAKLNPIAGALESLLAEVEYGTEHKEYSIIEKVKTTDTPRIKAKARASVNEIRNYFADFRSYCQSAQALIVTAQSRLKRLVIEKSAKGIDFTGDVSKAEESETIKKPFTNWK